MRDSDTYQAILEEGVEKGLEKGREEGRVEGRVEELHRTLLRQGRKRFGEPDEATRRTICGIDDVERLEDLSDRLLDVSSWGELLA